MKERDPLPVSRRTFLVNASCAAAYATLNPLLGKFIETPAPSDETKEPNDQLYSYQRKIFEKMKVLEAFELEEQLKREGKYSFDQSNAVRIGFMGPYGITRIRSESPPVPGSDVAYKRVIPDEGLYELDKKGNPFAHGTQVAFSGGGIAIINNGQGLAGLRGPIPITVRQVKIFNQDQHQYFWGAGLDDFRDHPVDVLIISDGIEDSRDIATKINYLAKEMNTIILASAGNESSDRSYYRYLNLISVGAIRLSDDEKWDDSNYGKIDMAAYGTDVPSLIPVNQDGEFKLAYFSRTSAAVSQVGNLAVHLRFFNRELSASEALEIMQSTGTKVAGKYNWKLPNYYEAVKKIT